MFYHGTCPCPWFAQTRTSMCAVMRRDLISIHSALLCVYPQATTMTLMFSNLDASPSSPFIDDVSICPTQSMCARVVNNGFEVDQHGNLCVVPRPCFVGVLSHCESSHFCIYYIVSIVVSGSFSCIRTSLLAKGCVKHDPTLFASYSYILTAPHHFCMLLTLRLHLDTIIDSRT